MLKRVERVRSHTQLDQLMRKKGPDEDEEEELDSVGELEEADALPRPGRFGALQRQPTLQPQMFKDATPDETSSPEGDDLKSLFLTGKIA